MKKIGFVISHKDDEERRMLLPEHIHMIRHPENLYFETGYGEALSFADEAFLECGCKIVSREEALHCDVVVDRKLGDADYLDDLPQGRILFGAAHAVQNVVFTGKILTDKHTVLASEEIFEDGRYVFYKNNELAGEAAIMHAFCYAKRMPYETRVAVLGNGNVAKGAIRILNNLGAEVDVFGRKYEGLFQKKKYEYDVIVNCVKWDTGRTDHLISRTDLSRMKKGSLIIDISCDPHLGIETSRPTTITNPVYTVDGVLHYAVDNTPTLFPLAATRIMSERSWDYINVLMESDYPDYPQIMKTATVILDGHIMDQRIRAYRERRQLFCE